ncbi:MAG: tetratricopeptide repeat protein, partial [Patescibacteria group bacterium]|nr:tetratricopeptide repeat protein [Patescibacteria group bacterium]
DTYVPGEEPGDLLVLQGFAYFALGRYDDAVRSYQAVLARRPESPDVLYHLAQAQWMAGRPTDAAQAARQALTLQPGHQESLAILEQIEVAAADGVHRR